MDASRPGRATPSLKLSYNSQTVDNAIAAQTQASWVGMGWSLDTGGMERDQNGTPDNTSDETFSISAAGVNSLMLKGAAGTTTPPTRPSGASTLMEPTTSGTPGTKMGRRISLAIAETRAQYPSGYHNNCDSGNYTTDPTTWRWSLHKIRNIYGKELVFTYLTVYQLKEHPCDSGRTFNTAVAVYPATIEYPHGHYKVVFEAPRTARITKTSGQRSTI